MYIYIYIIICWLLVGYYYLCYLLVLPPEVSRQTGENEDLAWRFPKHGGITQHLHLWTPPSLGF